MTIKKRMPVLIKGAPGVGKSDIVIQVAKEFGMDMILMHPVVSDPTDFKGLPGIVNNEAEFLPYGDLRKLMDAKSPTIAFLDDLGQAPACVQASCMQLLLARQINGKPISRKVVFVAATNRREDRAGVTGILEPVKSRFATILELVPDFDSWKIWAQENRMPFELVGFLDFRKNLLSSGEATADIVNHPCPRTWAYVGNLIKAGLTSIEVLAGAVGEGAASELIGFLRVCNSLPDMDEILQNPKEAKLPSDPAAQYAVVAALVELANKKTATNIIIYGTRMPADFSVLLIRDMIRKDPNIQETRAYIQWANKHQDVILGE